MNAAITTAADLVQRLRDHGIELHGDTAPEVSAAILDRGIAEVIAGRGPDGKPQRYLQVFERVYGEPLGISATRSAA